MYDYRHPMSERYSKDYGNYRKVETGEKENQSYAYKQVRDRSAHLPSTRNMSNDSYGGRNSAQRSPVKPILKRS